MSAQIPSTMLLSDLLKATGYDCPEELQGKTFEEATTGGDAKISTNTDAEIDVSAYTEPVVIEPAKGYDATKKVTVELKNIPAGVTKLFAWKGSAIVVYTKTGTPVKNDDCYYSDSSTPVEIAKSFVGAVGEGYITIGAITEHKTRYAAGDITF